MMLSLTALKNISSLMVAIDLQKGFILSLLEFSSETS